MLGSNSLLQIVSCRSLGDSLQRLLDDRRVDGVYHVCGRHPWLFVREIDPAEDIDLRTVRAGHVTIAMPDPSWLPDASPLSARTLEMQNFIFLRPFVATGKAPSVATSAEVDLYRSKLTQAMEVAESRWRVRRRRLFKAIGSEWWFVAEVLTDQLTTLRSLLSHLATAAFDTSTKCVLVRCKDLYNTDGYREQDNRRRMRDFERTFRPSSQFKCATIVRNDRTFFLERYPDRQEEKLRRLLATPPSTEPGLGVEPLKRQLWQDLRGPYVEAGELRHPNQYVDRFTLRPVWDAWSFGFVFLRAAKEFRSDLPKKLAGIIGVYPHHIVPRIYQITGEYDYLVPAYVLGKDGLEELRAQVEKLPIDGNPNILTAEIPDVKERQRLEQLGDYACRAALALFRNAAMSKTLWGEIKDLAAGWRQWTAKERLLEWTDRLSPRARSVIPSASISADDLEAIKGETEDLGLGLTWEFAQDKVEMAFVRLTPRDSRYFRQLREEVQRLTGKGLRPEEHHVAFDYFQTSAAEIVGIVRFVDRREIERLLLKTKDFCEHTEFHLIIGFIASIPNLAESERCAPCVYPVAGGLRPRELDCAHCGRYLRTATGGERLKIRTDLRGDRLTGARRRKQLSEVRVGLLDLSLTVADLETIGAIPPAAGPKRKRTTDDYSPGAPWRVSCERYARDLASALVNGELKDATVVVLPEYCVPLSAVPILVKALRERKRRGLFVLGSHLDERGYNVSPVIYADNGEVAWYSQHKQRLAPLEEQLGHVTGMGTASHLFRTDFGHFIVQVCFDAFNVHSRGVLDADAVLVPSFQPGGESLPKNLADDPMLSSRLVVFANGAASSNSQKRRHTRSRIVAGKHVYWPDRTRKMPLGSFEGIPLVAPVNLLDLDLARGADTGGRLPAGILPIHVDLWAHREKETRQDCLKERLRELRELIVAPGAAARDYFTLEWKEAE